MKRSLFLVLCLIAMKQLAGQWYQVISGTNKDIQAICFTDSLTGFGLVKNAVIKTSDAGENWEVLFSDSALFSNMFIVAIKDSIIVFCTDSLGLKYKLLFASDSGNYSKQSLAYDPYYPAYFNKDVWYSENSTLKKYDNGNKTSMLAFPGLQYFFIHNDFISVPSATDVYTSRNFGLTWDTIQFSTTPLSSAPYESYFDGSDTILAVTNYPTNIHYSHDAGISWNMYNAPAFYFYFINRRIIVGVGLYKFNSNVVGVSVNAGQSFRLDTLSNSLKGCYIYNNLCFVYGEDGAIYKNLHLVEQVGMDENEKLKKKIKIYPVPSREFLTIEAAEEIHIKNIQLIDMQGKIIKSYPQHEKQLKIFDLAKGEYLLQFRTDKGMLIKKILIE